MRFMLIVHPVHEMSGNITKLEQELQTMAEGKELAKEEEVVAGSVWAVHQQSFVSMLTFCVV